MTRRIIVPVDDSDGMWLSEHFGRARFFAIIEVDEKGQVVNKTVQPNTGEHMGGSGHAHSNIIAMDPDVVIVAGMGPRGLSIFQGRSIAVLRANDTVVERLIESYRMGELVELTEGCAEAHYP